MCPSAWYEIVDEYTSTTLLYANTGIGSLILSARCVNKKCATAVLLLYRHLAVNLKNLIPDRVQPQAILSYTKLGILLVTRRSTMLEAEPETLPSCSTSSRQSSDQEARILAEERSAREARLSAGNLLCRRTIMALPGAQCSARPILSASKPSWMNLRNTLARYEFRPRTIHTVTGHMFEP